MSISDHLLFVKKSYLHFFLNVFSKENFKRFFYLKFPFRHLTTVLHCDIMLYEGGDLTPTTLVSLRIDSELLEYLKQRAEQEHRSLSNMVIFILMEEKERKEGKEE